MRSGYVGNQGVFSKDKAVIPMVVAVSQGMANQHRPPRMYPGSAWTGEEAMALL
jgi:hypothetical protein